MRNAKKVFNKLNEKGFLNILSDKQYTILEYWAKNRKILDLRHPKTFNEKLNWLKLYSTDDYSKLVDKYDVMEYVESVIGKGYCIPKLGVYSSFDEIDINTLPNQFVLKCTHDSGGVVICNDKSKFDVDKARQTLDNSLKKNFYWVHRERAYRNLKPRIICEQYLEDESKAGLIDYKFFCFDGEPQFMFIATGRSSGNTCFDFFDLDFNWIPVKNHYPNANCRPKKPEMFEKMIELSRKLSRGMKQVRVDFFQCKDKIYFGELTFIHFGGIEEFEPSSYNLEFGRYIKL